MKAPVVPHSSSKRTVGPSLTLTLLVLPFKGHLLAASAVGLVAGILGWCVPFFVQKVLDHTASSSTLAWISVAVALGISFRSVLIVARRMLQMALARKIEAERVEAFLRHSLRIGMKDYERFTGDDILSRVLGLEHLRHTIEDRVVSVFFDAILVVIAAIVVAHHSLALAALAALGALVPAVVVYFVKRGIQSSFRKTQDLAAQMNGYCLDTFRGIRDIKLLGGEDWLLRRILTSHGEAQSARNRHHFQLSVIGNATSLVSTLLGVAILAVGTLGLPNNRLSQGQLMFAFTMAGVMLGPLENLVISWLFFENAVGALSRCNEVMDVPAEHDSISKAPLEASDILIEGVSFSYKPGEDALRNVSIRFPAGRSVAIVGESGAGKSTLLGLLAGIYRPATGRVVANGVDLKDIGRADWRRHTAAVFQSPHLFRGTLEENLVMGLEESSAEDLSRALLEASAVSFISRLPDGVRTSIDSDAPPFSAGELQRLSIARALVRHPRLLLLDEATSNLDIDTEAAVWKAIEAGRGERTTIFVTHRLSSSARADWICVLESGKVLEEGTFSDLLARKGKYFDLWKRQNPVSFLGDVPGHSGAHPKPDAASSRPQFGAHS